MIINNFGAFIVYKELSHTFSHLLTIVSNTIKLIRKRPVLKRLFIYLDVVTDGFFPKET